MFAVRRRLELLLHRRHGHDAAMGVLQMQPGLVGLNRAGLQEKDAGDDLQAVRHAVLHLLQQRLLLGQYLGQPMLTASVDETSAAPARTSTRMGRFSPIIEAARVSHSRER